jgi:hypothetical protein
MTGAARELRLTQLGVSQHVIRCASAKSPLFGKKSTLRPFRTAIFPGKRRFCSLDAQH